MVGFKEAPHGVVGENIVADKVPQAAEEGFKIAGVAESHVLIGGGEFFGDPGRGGDVESGVSFPWREIMEDFHFAFNELDLGGVGLDQGELRLRKRTLQLKGGAAAGADGEDTLGGVVLQNLNFKRRVFSDHGELNGVVSHGPPCLFDG